MLKISQSFGFDFCFALFERDFFRSTKDFLQFFLITLILNFFPQKNGTAKDIITVFSGKGDIRRLNLIEKVNGVDKMHFWKTEQCNRINGSDGSLFPPHFDRNTTLYVYEKDLCRLLPLTYVLIYSNTFCVWCFVFVITVTFF